MTAALSMTAPALSPLVEAADSMGMASHSSLLGLVREQSWAVPGRSLEVLATARGVWRAVPFVIGARTLLCEALADCTLDFALWHATCMDGLSPLVCAIEGRHVLLL